MGVNKKPRPKKSDSVDWLMAWEGRRAAPVGVGGPEGDDGEGRLDGLEDRLLGCHRIERPQEGAGLILRPNGGVDGMASGFKDKDGPEGLVVSAHPLATYLMVLFAHPI